MQVAVVLSAVLAFASFNEIPSSLQLAGSLAIIIGVTFVSLR
jgi:drug/metabolite transporter (DMT)-like permease